ncbi:hypothetical protein QYF61_016676 [Mycteria americana]|uniref:Uncharacterized protein n=1 Tax=Mycteria americana TaxID=33587 RepID=A0AAN7PDQ2_MYCAM|nr:hypothetical protein QYF61_016676 [Mycteria americana]
MGGVGTDSPREMRWTENWLNRWPQRVVISSTKSSWKSVTTGVPLGSIQSSILFNIFIENLGDGAEFTLAQNWKKQLIYQQRDLNKLEKQADKNIMQICKGKCQVLTLPEQAVGQDDLQQSLPTSTNLCYEGQEGDRIDYDKQHEVQLDASD